MPFRVLHCVHSVNPRGGGPIEGIKQLSGVNARHGHSIEIASLDRSDDPWVRECPVRVNALGPGWLGYGYTPRWKPWIEQHHASFDVVVINGIWQYNGLGTWRALRKTSTPYLVFTHGMLDPWFKRRYPLKHFKKALYWHWGDYRVLRDAAAVLFTAEEERRTARMSFPRYRAVERVVSYGTVAHQDFDAERHRRLVAERWPSMIGKRCLLHLGRVHEKKGTDLVLHAFARFRQTLGDAERAEWHLIIAGPADNNYGE